MARWTFHIFAGLSLVLMIASCVAWVRSVDRWEFAEWAEGQNEGLVGYVRGNYFLSKITVKSKWLVDPDRPLRWWVKSSEWRNSLAAYHVDTITHLQLVVLEYHATNPEDDHASYETKRVFITPIWFVTLLLALMPSWWLLTYRKRGRRYRLKRGLCITCGYDMQGSPNACPECGRTT